MRSTPPALQIAAENVPPGDAARSESGELSRDGHRPSMVDRAIQVCEMNNGAIILSAKMATYIGLPLSRWIEPSGSRVYSGRTQCERALVRATKIFSTKCFNYYSI